LLVHWAEAAPERVFLAAVRRLGQGLLDRGLSAERPLAILSDNGDDVIVLA
jgi:hypothetical protein